MHPFNAWHSVKDCTIVGAIRNAPIEPGMTTPRFSSSRPAHPGSKGSYRTEVRRRERQVRRSRRGITQVATELRCHFLDAGHITATSPIDGVHLDPDQHLLLGREIARLVGGILTAAASHGAVH